MNTVIPDASILLAPILDEPEFTNPITKLLLKARAGNVQMIVPSICEYEVANTLARKKGHTAEDVEIALGSCFVHHLSRPILTRALQLMKQQKKISIYDASYHALAIESDGVFLTADKQYVDLMHSAGNIQFIGDYA